MSVHEQITTIQDLYNGNDDAALSLMESLGKARYGEYTNEAFRRAAEQIVKVQSPELSLEETIKAMSRGDMHTAATIMQELDESANVQDKIVPSGEWEQYVEKAKQVCE